MGKKKKKKKCPGGGAPELIPRLGTALYCTAVRTVRSNNLGLVCTWKVKVWCLVACLSPPWRQGKEPRCGLRTLHLSTTWNVKNYFFYLFFLKLIAYRCGLLTYVTEQTLWAQPVNET